MKLSPHEMAVGQGMLRVMLRLVESDMSAGILEFERNEEKFVKCVQNLLMKAGFCVKNHKAATAVT